jgi:hypothetical protein
MARKNPHHKLKLKAACEAEITHSQGVMAGNELLFETRFDYMFPKLARTPAARVAETDETIDALKALGTAMAEPNSAPDNKFDSGLPAVFTYLGQFIDHDVTARTDRDGNFTDLERIGLDGRREPDHVIAKLANGRRPQLDLDSVYGDGPGLVDTPSPDQNRSVAERLGIFDSQTLKLKLQQIAAKKIDLPRDQARDGAAQIGDGRNDENVIVGQLHAAFLAFHNAVCDQLNLGSAALDYVRARQLVRWAYQWVVLHDYLPRVCDPTVVADVLANGPRYFGVPAGRDFVFMPLEFSVAAFRFGHTMIRPKYKLNGQTDQAIDSLFFPSRDLPGRPALVQNSRLRNAFIVDWSRFAGTGNKVQKARRFDPLLSRGLDNLRFESTAVEGLKRLAVRNLLRGYSLSLPTGQAVAMAMGIDPLPEEVVGDADTQDLRDALAMNRFDSQTPLFYYLLREASVQVDGRHLGEVGSRIVAETLVGLIKGDPTGVLANRHDPAVQADGVDCGVGKVAGIADVLSGAGVL